MNSNTETQHERFQIEIDDETTLRRDDTLAHKKYGPMHVAGITISAFGKRARLQADMREDGLSIEMTEEEMQEAWGETLASTPMALDDGKTWYEKNFASKDDEIKVTLEAEGPEDDVQPVMAHLHDQTIRVLQAMENEKPPEDCEGMYEIDWDGIFAEEVGSDE